MDLFSELLTVTGAVAGILLLLALAVTPLLREPRPRRTAAPATGRAAAAIPPAEPVAPEPEPALPRPAGGTATAVRELALPVPRRATAVTIPGQRRATHLS